MATSAVSDAPRPGVRASRTFGSLDGLRCISILAVLWHHARPPSVAWPPMAHNGFLGVDLFFVISGFLITTLLLRERDARGEISLRAFYARRALRIFPPYYGLLLALAFVLGFVAPGARMAEPFFAELPWYATYTSNWIEAHTLLGISWSLAAEEQFYLVWPPIERFARRAALPLLGLAILVNQLVNFRVGDDFVARALGLRYDELSMLQATFTPILLGVGLAHALHGPTGPRVTRWLAARGAAPLALVLLLAAVNWPGSLTGAPRLAIQLAMTGLVGACVARESHALAPLLASRPLRYVGSISYGMYLYHLLVMIPVDKVLARLPVEIPAGRFLLVSALTIAVAGVSYRWYERPFLRWKERFAPGGSPVKKASSAARERPKRNLP